MKVVVESCQGYEILKVEGVPTVEELVKEVSVVYRNHKSKRNIWDFSGCSVAQLHIADYGRIIAAVKQYTGTSGSYRTALVLHSEIEQILGETFEAMAIAASVPVEYKVFGTLQPAIKWITE